MKFDQGSRELTRLVTAHIVGGAFCVTFLVATLSGTSGSTALLRALLVAAIALVLGRLLAAPAVEQVLAAMARDAAQRRAAAKEDDA